MIELTAGVLFLLSSMYGTGAVTAEISDNQMQATPISGATAVIAALDKKALEQYLNEHFSDTPILIEIAKCESTLTHFGKNGKVIRGRVDSADVGVMQINERYHLEMAEKLGYDIHTVEGNVQYAKYLYDKFGTKPWNSSKPCWGSKVIAMK